MDQVCNVGACIFLNKRWPSVSWQRIMFTQNDVHQVTFSEKMLLGVRHFGQTWLAGRHVSWGKITWQCHVNIYISNETDHIIFYTIFSSSWAASPFQGLSKMGSQTDQDQMTNFRPKKTKASHFESPAHVTQPQHVNNHPKPNHWIKWIPPTCKTINWVHKVEIILRQTIMVVLRVKSLLIQGWSKVSQFNTNATHLAATHNMSQGSQHLYQYFPACYTLVHSPCCHNMVPIP
jgi:hypothetical protein